jgi:hypothetical protein
MNLSQFYNGIHIYKNYKFFNFINTNIIKSLGRNRRKVKLSNRVFSEFYEDLYRGLLHNISDYLTVILFNFGLQQLSMRRFNYSGSEEYIYISGSDGSLCYEGLKSTVYIKGTLIFNGLIKNQYSRLTKINGEHTLIPNIISYKKNEELLGVIKNLNSELNFGIIVIEGLNNIDLIKKSLILLNQKATKYADIIIIERYDVIKNIKIFCTEIGFNVSEVLKTKKYSFLKIDNHFDNYLKIINVGYK